MIYKRPSGVPGISRREFVQNTAAVAAFAAAGLGPLRAAEKAEARKMIGVQVGAVSVVDESFGNGPAKQAKPLNAGSRRRQSALSPPPK